MWFGSQTYGQLANLRISCAGGSSSTAVVPPRSSLAVLLSSNGMGGLRCGCLGRGDWPQSWVSNRFHFGIGDAARFASATRTLLVRRGRGFTAFNHFPGRFLASNCFTDLDTVVSRKRAAQTLVAAWLHGFRVPTVS